MNSLREPLISIRDLEHAYGSGALRKQILADINTDINAGEIVILTGPWLPGRASCWPTSRRLPWASTPGAR